MVKTEDKPNVLYFFTADFPYGDQEVFIETEIKYLSKKFERIIIVSHNINSINARPVPKNTEVIRIRYNPSLLEKIISLRCIFYKIIWDEIATIKSRFKMKITFGILKTLFISMQNAKRLQSIYLRKVFPDQQKDAVFYSYWLTDWTIALAFIKNANQKIRIVSKMHRWDIYFENSKYKYLPLRKFVLNNLNKIYSISQDGIRYTNQLLGEETSNIKLSRLGINKNMNFFNNNSSDFTIVSCSNILGFKRVKLIAEVLNSLDLKNLKWVHFGSQFGDGNIFNELKIYCDKFLKGKVEYVFKGRTPNLEVMEFYKKNKASLFINLSSSEGIPVSIMEAMSFGIPVIATDVGGTSEIVNNENGYLLDSDPTIDAVADSITKYYKMSHEEKGRKKKAAYFTWENKYNAQKNYSEFVEDILKL